MMRTCCFFSALWIALGLTSSGQEAEAEFTRKFNNGAEPAILLEDHGSDDGAISLIFSARKKELSPAKWPSIIADVSINATEVDVDKCTTENWIVSTQEQLRLGVVKSSHPEFRAYYPDQHQNELAALWGNDQEGWRYGVLNYTGRWSCTEIFFVNCDGVEAKVTSMRALLDKASAAVVATKTNNAGDYEIRYELLEFVKPEESATVADPLSIRIKFIAEVPKNDQADPIEGTHLVKLSRDNKGAASATLIGAATAETPVARGAVPSDADFSAWRDQSLATVKARKWQAVKKVFPTKEAEHQKFVTGWHSANVMQQLTRVESRGNEDLQIASYFWREGVLLSISKYASGSYTGEEGVKQITDTYNFHEGRLVSWSNSKTGQQDPAQRGFQELGAVLQKEAIFWSEPIYEMIGAD